MSRSWSWQRIVLVSLAAVIVAYGLEQLTVRFWARMRPGATLVLTIDSAHPFDEGLPPDEARRRTLAVLRDRVGKLSPLALATFTGDRLEVLLPRGEAPAPVVQLLTRSGRLEFKLVDDGADYMKEVAGGVAREPPDGVEVGRDGWSEKESGAAHADVYLRAPDATTLARAWTLVTDKLPLPKDHDVAFEKRADETAASWRSYYVYRHAELTGENIQDVEVSWDQHSGRPEVALAFDSSGAKAFEALTARAVGRKLAILLEGRVNSAPVIEGKIAGGRARITMGGNTDPFTLQEEAKDLVAVLRSGGTAAPVQLVELRGPR